MNDHLSDDATRDPTPLRSGDDLSAGKEPADDALRELEALAYAVSHNLRAPLRSIDGFSQALIEDYGPQLDARGVEYLERVRTAAGRMARLIDAMLGLSRVARAPMTPRTVDLSALARQIASAYPSARVTVRDAMTVRADPVLLCQALSCLIDNAVKFSSKRADALVEFGAGISRGRVAFFVRDNGAGFDPARAEKLFAPFQRFHAAEEFPGDGIGLALVQRIVRRHGGDVWVEARRGAGATFWFTLGGETDP